MGSMGINIRSGMSFERWVVDDREVPLDVRTRQFKTMAKVFGYSSVEAFGLAVEKMKSETRTQLLGVFYRHRRELLTRNEG
jgi:hypothetical protein